MEDTKGFVTVVVAMLARKWRRRNYVKFKMLNFIIYKITTALTKNFQLFRLNEFFLLSTIVNKKCVNNNCNNNGIVTMKKTHFPLFVRHTLIVERVVGCIHSTVHIIFQFIFHS